MFDPDELPPPPPLSPQTYDRLQKTLAEKGPKAAVDQLCADLRELGDFNALFYALLMKKRVELGVCPFPTGAAAICRRTPTGPTSRRSARPGGWSAASS